MVVPNKRRPNVSSVDNRQKIADEIVSLQNRIENEAPAQGYAPPLNQVIAFRALPLSDMTLRGLDQAKQSFLTMTDIQNACIPHALAGRDILGAARTGSGKTLAFLIPILETLFRHQFTPDDGPGAIVLSPTRELSMQIFQVLRIVGKFHSFSVGLLVGGRKDFYEEQQQIRSTNIVIATPGRLLQHFEQTPYFNVAELKLLVLDEADRILDMGFRDQLVRVLDYLPNERQTLLFSATQTRDVKQLATLSLSKPEYLGVHDKEKTTTPDSLQQSYVVVPLEHKLDAVYSFIKSHLKSKAIIFMSSCAQVRFAWELFCSLRPGVPVMALHGKLIQEKRTKVYYDFSQRPHAVLFATDIAARGLDFKNVDWVVQMDAPEDRSMYIHRVGRTARYRAGGKSLLMLTEAEEKNGFVDILRGKNATAIPLKRLKINPDKTVGVAERAAALVASNVKLHSLAKKNFHSYVRSIHLMPLQHVFKVNELNLNDFGKSLGLASTPNLRFLSTAPANRSALRQAKNVNRKLQKLKEQIKAEKLTKKVQALGGSLPSRSVSAARLDIDSSDSESDDELLVSKSRESFESTVASLPQVDREMSLKIQASRKIRIEGSSSTSNSKVVFDEAGNALPTKDAATFLQHRNTSDVHAGNEKLEHASEIYADKVSERLQRNMARDREEEKVRIRTIHKKKRLDEKKEKQTAAPDAVLALSNESESDTSSIAESKSFVLSDNDNASSSTTFTLNSKPASDARKRTHDEMVEREQIALSLIRGREKA